MFSILSPHTFAGDPKILGGYEIKLYICQIIDH